MTKRLAKTFHPRQTLLYLTIYWLVVTAPLHHYLSLSLCWLPWPPWSPSLLSLHPWLSKSESRSKPFASSNSFWENQPPSLEKSLEDRILQFWRLNLTTLWDPDPSDPWWTLFCLICRLFALHSCYFLNMTIFQNVQTKPIKKVIFNNKKMLRKRRLGSYHP